MKLEEKSKVYAQNVPEHNHMREDAEGSFISGANWMLEKAFYWLKDHAGDYAITAETESGLTYPTIDIDLFSDFEKAMKE